MFSKFSLDQTDPISKLGAKVEPEGSIEDTPEERRYWANRRFTQYEHDLPLEYRVQRAEQKAVVGPKVEVLHWPSLEFKPVDMRSAYWQEQIGETPRPETAVLRLADCVSPEWMRIAVMLSDAARKLCGGATS